MAHVWTGRGGVSNPDYGLQSGLQDSPVERFCNRVAAETLVQSEDFLSRWRTGNVPPEDNITRLRKHYKVSDMVILRQALDNGLIDLPEYQRRYAGLPRQAEAAEAARKDAGGNFYRTLVSRNGRALTEAIIRSAARGTTLSSEAALPAWGEGGIPSRHSRAPYREQTGPWLTIGRTAASSLRV